MFSLRTNRLQFTISTSLILKNIGKIHIPLTELVFFQDLQRARIIHKVFICTDKYLSANISFLSLIVYTWDRSREI